MKSNSWIIRPLKATDSLTELTTLLHRAYAPLAAQNMHYVASHQTEDITKRRILRGECFIVTRSPEAPSQHDQILGTIIFESAHQTQGCPFYNLPHVSSFHQFAVDPDFQGHGLGRLLLNKVEQRARETGAKELALDTAETAHQLISMYQDLGFKIVGDADWDSTNYKSVIMSKPVQSP